MLNLSSLSLLDLLPDSIKNDNEIATIAYALDYELQQITKCIEEIIMMPRIDELPEDIIDALAWQLHVDFYEPLGLDLEKKRALVKNSINWHRRKGTKSVLVEMIRILFFENFSIEEWFEYGGEPYFFRLVVKDLIESKDMYTRLIRAVYELKNVRSWLEKIILQRESSNTIYVGYVFKQRNKYAVSLKPPSFDFSIGIYTGVIIKQRKRFHISCKLQNSDFSIEAYMGTIIKQRKHLIIPAKKEIYVEPLEIYTNQQLKQVKKISIEAGGGDK